MPVGLRPTQRPSMARFRHYLRLLSIARQRRSFGVPGYASDHSPSAPVPQRLPVQSRVCEGRNDRFLHHQSAGRGAYSWRLSILILKRLNSENKTDDVGGQHLIPAVVSDRRASSNARGRSICIVSRPRAGPTWSHESSGATVGNFRTDQAH